jgi:hypothetical protein
MTIGYSVYQRLQQLELRAKKLGFKIGKSQYSDFFALAPGDPDCLPFYTREVEIYTGSLQDLETWLLGYEQAFFYLKLIKATTDSKIQKCEEKVKHELLLTILKQNNSA